MSQITRILSDIGRGDAAAAEQLMPLVYEQLRQLAAAKMAREGKEQTLQPTALVHEAWLRVAGEHQGNWQNRAHFFAAAAEAMRRILVERARRRKAVRHGGGRAREDTAAFEAIQTAQRDDQLDYLSEALDQLAVEHPQHAELVKLRYFVGMTIDEAAEVLGVSPPTAKRRWTFARAWLFRQMRN
jgi:RNA polymerase sigma factor (TIGR02999 family)